MLEELHVRDLALIEEVWLEFGPGMTVLTGETGAGKTALVGALKLLIGERADSTLVRAGAEETLVEGRIRVGASEFVAKRRVSADGRSRCHLDGEMATVGQLSETLGPLFDLHGQHEHQALLSPSNHCGYLDRYIGEPAATALAAYREALHGFRQARDSLREAETRRLEAESRVDYLRFVANEIASAAPTDGEDAELDRRMPALRHSEKLSEAASEAFAVTRGDSGASDALALALSALERVKGLDPALDELVARLSDAAAQIDEVGLELRQYGEGIEHDPRALDAAEARLSTLAGLKKKYGPQLSDVIRTREEAENTLSSLEDSEGGLSGFRARLEEAQSDLQAKAARLSTLRHEAVCLFVHELEGAVAELAMPGARFDVSLEELDFEGWTQDGPHRLEFLFAPAEDQPFRPLAKIASGGEVSRVMLAMKGVLGEADQVPVLVFDEVDAGIGGATATAVGRRLAELARSHQVLVVTHLAQVAALADSHLVVEKLVCDGSTSTLVRVVEGDDRVAEIARMLSGGESATSLAHAEELLATAEASS